MAVCPSTRAGIRGEPRYRIHGVTTLAVLTRDLRISDNPVLSASGAEAVPVFIGDPRAESLHGSPNRQAYLAESLHDIDTQLRSLGSSLVYRRGRWVDEVLRVAAEAGAREIHVARDVSRYGSDRLRDLTHASPVPVVAHDSLTVVPPDAVRTRAGTPYLVFTPWHRAWASQEWRAPLASPDRLGPSRLSSEPLPSIPTDGTSPHRRIGGERNERRDFERWLRRAVRYGDTRNDLTDPLGTSQISAALHFGTLSPLEVATAATEVGADAFARQIGWRDFNHQLLFNHPKASTEDLRGDARWLDDPEALRAWCEGTTGYPLVDAAMRQLLATGWIHNRARMVAASFLTKHLLIDWRLGARWFMDWLTDGDVANNQLGWQWVAGTGVDTNPHRVFNPTLQGRRFDPDGVYIRRWVPELADLAPPVIHDPDPVTREHHGYPMPLIDHREAIERYRSVRFGDGATRPIQQRMPV